MPTAALRRRPAAAFVAVDLGSARLRAWWPGLRAVRDDAPSPAHARGLSRGLVLDPQIVAGELSAAASDVRAASALLSVPVHAGHDDVAAAHAAAVDGLGVTHVWPVPAAVAAALATLGDEPGVVVDLGAGLVEVSRVEAGRVRDRDVLGWGVDDLLVALGEVLAARHGVDVAPGELLRALHGSLAAGRDVRSGAVRIIRVDRADVEAAAAAPLQWVASRVGLLRRGPERVVAVGGGARLPVLRLAALDWVGRLWSPVDPQHATVRGLARLAAA